MSPVAPWDDIANDFQTFSEIVGPKLPDFVPVGTLLIPKSLLLVEAWAQPYTAFGIACRAIYFAQLATSVQPAANAAWQAVNNAVLRNPKQQITLKGSTSMSALVIPNVYRVAIEMASGGKPITNVIHVEGSASGQEAAAAAAVLAAWKVASGPLSKLSSLVAMTQVVAMDLSSTNGGISAITDTTAGGDASTNSLATRGACALIKLNGGTRSKSSRGRIYFGPSMEKEINSDGATLQSSTMTSHNTAFTNFRNSLSGAGFTLGVASRKLATFTSVSSHAVEATIATQRRRIRS